MEIARDKLMRGEVGVQDVEKLHQARGYKLRDRQVRREGKLRAKVAEGSWTLEGVSVGPGHGSITHTQEARRHGVDLTGVELKELAVVVDEDIALEGLLGERVIAQAVVGEVIEDFEGKEEARGRDVGVPVEYGAVDDLNLVQVAPRRCRLLEVVDLQRSQRGGDFNDAEFCAFVDFRMHVSNVVEDVDHESSVTSTHLIYQQIVVRILR